MIKVKVFDSPETGGYNEFERWQENHPDLEIKETKLITETQSYTKVKLAVTYEV